jgi:retinol dehydrogenase 14
MAADLPRGGRVAVVTGATRGIGREVAQGLAQLGFRTVVVARGADRTLAAAAEIARSTGNRQVDAVVAGDLAERSQVRELAGRLAETYPQIHVLVNNAGAFFARRAATSDGLERTFALNVLAPFALTSLLLDRLRAAAPARVVQVSSAAHHGQRVEFDNLQGERVYHGYEAYGRSKLELILLTREFARRLAGSDIAVNAVHPGFIRSGFGDNNEGGVGFGVRLSKFLFARSLRYGGENVLYVATDPAAGATSGAYFTRRRRGRVSRNAEDPEAARRLFEICRELTGVPELPAPPVPVAGPGFPGPAAAPGAG